MNQVILRPLAITSLSIQYARIMPNNKIIHYSVSSLPAITGYATKSPLQMVKDYILQNEPDAQIMVIDNPIKDNGLSTVDATQLVLPGRFNKVRRQLLKLKSHRLDQERLIYTNASDRYKDLISYYVNFNVILPLNKLINKIKGREEINIDPKLAREYYGRFPFRNALMFPSTLPYLNDQRYQRGFDFVHFLGVSYREKDEKLAAKKLREDLTILSDKGLILGHLAMPSCLDLADSIGDGHKRKTLFCFVLINSAKARELLGGPIDQSKLYLEKFGITTECLEGALPEYVYSKDPDENYEIEIIDIKNDDFDNNRKAVIDSYLESREAVNKVASIKKKDISQYEKVDSSSETVVGQLANLTNVLVNVELQKKQ